MVAAKVEQTSKNEKQKIGRSSFQVLKMEVDVLIDDSSPLETDALASAQTIAKITNLNTVRNCNHHVWGRNALLQWHCR